ARQLEAPVQIKQKVAGEPLGIGGVPGEERRLALTDENRLQKVPVGLGLCIGVAPSPAGPELEVGVAEKEGPESGIVLQDAEAFLQGEHDVRPVITGVRRLAAMLDFVARMSQDELDLGQLPARDAAPTRRFNVP